MNKILIVDDEQVVLETLLHSLGRKGYKVETAASGQEALEKAKKSRFDVALLDIKLPDIDGIQTLKELKKINPEIEAIMITGYGSINTVIDSMREGAYDYVEKPVSSDRIAVLIEKALEKHQLTETVALYEISKKIFSTIELEALLKTIVDLAMKVLQGDDTSVMLFDESGGLSIAISSGLDEQVKKQTRLALGERIAGWVAENKEAIILINGLRNDERFKDVGCREEIKSAIVIPLIKNNTVLGILSVNRINILENFTKIDLYKANIFASLVSLALDNANLYNSQLKLQKQLVSANEETRLLNLSLESKVKERTQELTRVNEELTCLAEQLKRANNAKSEFLATMNHELRTPLNSIIGFAEILADEKSGPLNEQQKEFLNYVLVSGKHLMALISDILDLAKMEAGKMEISPSNLEIKKLLGDTMILIKEIAFRKKIEVLPEIPEDIGHVEADERRVKQIVYNLISNAVKFTPLGGKMGIRAKRSDSEIEVEVWDNGIGIAPENLGKLFQAFQRIDSPYSRAIEGTGLGLSHSKKLVELHGGRIWIESQGLNKGTSVKFTLPLKR